jgi:uncharacterized protein YhaN
MTVADFRLLLFQGYKITLTNLKFDEIVERFFRIYGRGNHNEHKPLQCERETMPTAVEYLMKLLGKYEDIYNLKVAEEQYGVKPTKAAERSISVISAEIGDNLAKIEGLENRRTKLMAQNEEGNLHALGLDHEKTQQLADIRKRLDQLDSRRERLEGQLRAIRSNMPDKNGRLNKDFSALLQFFPDADLEELTDVENFHSRINGFLSADIEEEIGLLQPQLDDVNGEIADLDKRIEESGIAKNLSKQILNSYARVAREIDDLMKKNKELEAEIDGIKRRNELEELLSNLRKKHNKALAVAEMEVNNKMKELNAAVTDGNRAAPVLVLRPDKSFEFGTPDDKSEGTAFKNLVVYDLSMLAMTPAPILIHDSSIVKRIEDGDFEQILGQYQASAKAGKQVFIAFDKADAYTDKTFTALESAAVLHLSVGNELFGTSWSRTMPAAEQDNKPIDAAEPTAEQIPEEEEGE